MQSRTISAAAAPSPVAATTPRLSAAVLAALVTLAALWFVLCRQLSSEWSLNEQYNYGWFVPFFAAYLFWLRWEDRPVGRGGLDGSAAQGSGAEVGRLEHQDRPAAVDTSVPTRTGMRLRAAAMAGVLLLALLFPIRLVEGANPDWRPLSWLHAFCVAGLTLLAIYRVGGSAWLRHFTFPVLFMLVAVPWVTPIEQPIVQGLMRTVAAFATEVLNLCGVPAELQGNLIRLPSGTVGVNEACSGVRSLQTSIMLGLLFGELKRLTTPRRLVLVVAAVAIAIFANFLRALFLVSIAARDLSTLDVWHNRAGYAILVLVFVGSVALAAHLAKRQRQPEQSEAPRAGSTALRAIPLYWSVTALAWLCAIEVATEYWYRSHEKQFADLPRWTVHWPASAPGYRELPIDDRTRAVLLFDEGRQAIWTLPIQDSAFAGQRCNAFFFRWNAGGTSVVRARAHRPDICLPSAGWRLIADNGLRSYSTAGDLSLPFRHFRFVNATFTVDTFFCVYEDRAVEWGSLQTYRPDEQTSYAARWRNVRDGIRNTGQQVLQVAVFSTGAPALAAAEKTFAAQLRELVSPVAER